MPHAQKGRRTKGASPALLYQDRSRAGASVYCPVAMARMSVLFAASECAPFAKVGGLGDVVGALPAALHALGHDVRVVLPRYASIPTEGMRRHLAPLGVPMGHGDAWCAVYETRLPGTDVPVYLLDHQQLFGRGYLYDPPGGTAWDNLVRFAFLSRGALQLCRYLGWTPDVLHVHDWPTALVPVYLDTVEANTPLARTATVLTIHNIAHQGRFGAHDLPVTHIPPSVFIPQGLEEYGGVNLLKGGLYHATVLTTVSPTYAREVCTPEGGAGLHTVLSARAGDLFGILNGIDESVWNPKTDPWIAAAYGPEDLSGKAACKRALQREMDLDVRPEVPLLGMVSRLTGQKGLDVILAALDDILGMDTHVVVLGAGDRGVENILRARSASGGKSFRARVGHDEALAHRIEAGADFFLMPSWFEPCGMNQMYSQRYGTLPIVRATGGLDDTVDNHDPATGAGTGFKLWDLTPTTLRDTVAWALDVYRQQPQDFRRMQVRAMQKRQGWDIASKQYVEIYGRALEHRRWIHPAG